MKHYKLSGWPELPRQYQRTPYRRILSDMSQRFMTLAQLRQTSGLNSQRVSAFLSELSGHGVLIERGEAEPDTIFGLRQPLMGRRPSPHNSTTAEPRQRRR